MTDRTCITCHHCHVVNMPERGEEQRCFRVRTMVNKIGPEKGVIHPHGIGSSVVFERDSLPEPHRVAGDKCSVEGRHWLAKAEARQ